jgi:hypothetical protein
MSPIGLSVLRRKSSNSAFAPVRLSDFFQRESIAGIRRPQVGFREYFDIRIKTGISIIV